MAVHVARQEGDLRGLGVGEALPREPVAQAAAAQKPGDTVAGAGLGGDLGLERVEARGTQAGVALPVEAGAAVGLGTDAVAIGLPPPAQKADAFVMEQRGARQADGPRAVGDEEGGRVGCGHGPRRKL
jgi:hypothetical protein